MRWRYPLILFSFALVVFLVGLGYGVVMVGVPTQDATPAIAAKEARAERIAGWIMLVGAGAFVAALIWIVVVGVANIFRRRATT